MADGVMSHHSCCYLLLSSTSFYLHSPSLLLPSSFAPSSLLFSFFAPPSLLLLLLSSSSSFSPPPPSSRAHVKPSNDTPCCHGNDEIPAVGVSRKVWMKVSEERPHPSDDTAHEVTITPTLPSAAYHSRIAKYIHRYVPTPTSRCTSASAVSISTHHNSIHVST